MKRETMATVKIDFCDKNLNKLAYFFIQNNDFTVDNILFL